MSRIVMSVLAVAAILLAVPFLTATPTRAADDEDGVAPIWIMIPAIQIEAGIEEVAIDEGEMDEPEDPWAVGWYPDLGFLRDDRQMVMAGHVDWWGYGPTVFADLEDLEKEDQIVVGGEDGWTYIYEVTESWVVDEDSEPGDVWRVFHPAEEEAKKEATAVANGATVDDPEDKDYLTLITCSGDFDGVGYAARLVVRAELVERELTETD